MIKKILLVGTKLTCEQAAKLNFFQDEKLIPFPLLETQLVKNITFPRDSFDWIILTSPSAVKHFFELSNRPEFRKVAVIGPSTKVAIEKLGFSVGFMPMNYNAKSFGLEFAKLCTPGESMLFPSSSLADNSLQESLQESLEFFRINIYEPKNFMQENLPEYDAIAFFSSSAVEAFYENFKSEIITQKKIAAIGDKAAKKVEELFGLKAKIPKASTAAETIKVLL